MCYRRFPTVFLLLWLFIVPALFAAPVHLMVWQPSGQSTKLILPVAEGTEPREAAARYLSALQRNEALKPLLTHMWVSTAEGTFERLPDDGAKPRFALIDNDFTQRKREIRVLTEAGAAPFLIPVGAELALESPEEARDFRRVVASQFDALVALGGDDIDPSLYHEVVTYSRNINPTRDRMEVALIREYLASGRGILYGICRGHQLIAVTLGYHLIQDLPREMGITGHGSGMHAISITPGSLLSEFLGGATEAVVNSYHHQAVRPGSNPHGILKVSAVAGSGDKEVIEGIQSADGKIFTVQFHPELLDNEIGRNVLAGMVDHAAKSRVAHCLAVAPCAELQNVVAPGAELQNVVAPCAELQNDELRIARARRR